eukprot:Amastigsp_a341022_18.p4 type:complete len:158 gc:universal Amastigsp_a341022_18:632-159(-)
MRSVSAIAARTWPARRSVSASEALTSATSWFVSAIAASSSATAWASAAMASSSWRTASICAASAELTSSKSDWASSICSWFAPPCGATAVSAGVNLYRQMRYSSRAMCPLASVSISRSALRISITVIVCSRDSRNLCEANSSSWLPAAFLPSRLWNF